ncbi:hypothetical protein P378_14750 [Desulforamulus profundi]|uniref:Phage P1-related protein n=1 Tax=Desulforamulus profundi TaxID=1383067 RepID=A0A2C6MBW5_9FIRM|nr:hypothetical protein [Desulforamulus profundi]PHJ37538.1 hypothetical protein P378_14750 [Desulforamulus profundi]
MPESPSWLPEIIKLEDYGGDWGRFIESIYQCFRTDFVDNTAFFQSLRVAIQREPMLNGKEETFWHIVTCEDENKCRYPDLRRCERIRWPKAILDNFSDKHIKIWETVRGRDKRTTIWFEPLDYVVILSNKRNYYLLITAYCVTNKSKRAKLKKEYERSLKG